MDLQGAVALVTGGGRGIGAAISEAFARSGARVAVTDIDENAAQQVAQSIGSDRGIGTRMDVTNSASINLALGRISTELGPVDILVNNAFVPISGSFLDVSQEDTRRSIEVILVGSMNVARAVLPHLHERGRGRIINIISDAGRVGEGRMVAYSSAKAGLIGFTTSLAKELGPLGITVNGVSPGATTTQTTLDSLASEGVSVESLVRRYPLRRLGEPQDIANAVLWLASPLASWVTGQVISVNGGFAT
jgi:NAD(P)-dependent dehydrogenase (short-subunit alcohol dehydrogenase family)